MDLLKSKQTLYSNFMGTTDAYEDADIILFGVPMDFTTSFRPGTRQGPMRIREVSIGIEEYSLYQDKSLEETSYYDAGDLDLPFGDVERCLELVGKATEEILNDHKFPIVLGGEHLISLPVIEKMYRKYGDELILIHLDAHADLREDYIGQKKSHAAIIRRCCDFMNPKHIYQFGIRSGTRDEFTYAKNHTNLYPFEVLEPLKSVIKKFGERPIHISLDIDVVDPAYACATGTPEAGGISSRELFDSLLLLKQCNIVGFDLVEVCPVYDVADRTSLLAAKIIRELILAVSK
jgi:agmatinase